MQNILPYEFYNRPADTVAVDLLGKSIVRNLNGKLLIGRIVETEAYLGPHDLACHSSKGKTPRTQVLFGPPGRVYVYIIYGLYHMLNFTTGPEGSAVLIRALEPISEGLIRTNGPGLLGEALNIRKELNGIDPTSDLSHLYVTSSETDQDFDVGISPRIGVESSGEWAKQPLRFFIKGNEFVSRK